jgi:hypothetical protein
MEGSWKWQVVVLTVQAMADASAYAVEMVQLEAVGMWASKVVQAYIRVAPSACTRQMQDLPV